MNNYSEEEINKIIQHYKNQKQKDKDKYLKNKDNEDFKIKNRERARLHYQNNKDKKAVKYQENKELLNTKSLLQYYKYNDKIETFKNKYPEKVEVLMKHGITC